MRWLTAVLVLGLLQCAPKSDVELFSDGDVRIDISANPKFGYRPLLVDFSAYLETKETSVEREVSEVKWVVKGPRGYEREIVQGSSNFQDEEDNKDGFFYMEYEFNIAGRYTVQLFVNKDEFVSRPVSVNVLDRPDESRKRF
ncbi:MAG: hypothetical protein KDC35_11130 [Acidobacteria bacterium]|nr:hypothetical protein [Acidobacteriota bacterium]